MDQRITVITLASPNVPRARAFYEKLGWKPGHHDKEVAFFQLNGAVLSLFERKAYAKDTKLPLAKVKPGGVTVALNLASKAKVDAAMAQAKKAGARVLKPAQDTFWGGYAGIFADLDGHPWEIAWNPFWKLDAKGNIKMK